jgi:DNA mismatch endonuclease (patch repair protein)
VTDVFSREKRSEVMSRIRSKGTLVEDALYRIIRESLGPRWRIDRNVVSLPGRPDVVIPALRLAIFVHGCFYHSCSKHGHVPKSNQEYWAPKLQRNVKRDSLNRARLRRLGFSVWVIWEHQLEGRKSDSTRSIMDRRLSRLILAIRAPESRGRLVIR